MQLLVEQSPDRTVIEFRRIVAVSLIPLVAGLYAPDNGRHRPHDCVKGEVMTLQHGKNLTANFRYVVFSVKDESGLLRFWLQ